MEAGAPEVLTLPVFPLVGSFVVVQFDGAYTPLNCALAGLKAALKPATAVTEITDKEIPRKKNMPSKKYTWQYTVTVKRHRVTTQATPRPSPTARRALAGSTAPVAPATVQPVSVGKPRGAHVSQHRADGQDINA